MIATVTLNPALDLFLGVERVEFDAVLRARHERRAAGGKGMNVTRMLARLGRPSRAVILGGGGVAQEIVELARAEGLEVTLVDSRVPTRVNVHIEESSGRHVKVNMAGESVDPSAMDRVIGEMAALGAELSAVALSGSLPAGMSNDAWGNLVRACKERGVPSALDASGAGLKGGVAAQPTIVKINRTELGEWFGEPLADRARTVAAMKALRTGATQVVAVTASGDGACMLDEAGLWECTAPTQSAHRAVGAGDSFLAGLLDAWIAGRRGGEALSWAVASGTAWALHGTRVARAEVEALASACRPTQG